MPLPFIIGGIGAALSAVGGAAAAVGGAAATAAATVGTAAAATAATVGTAAATVGTAAVGAATSTAGMAAIGTAATAVGVKKKLENVEYDAYKRGVRAGEYGLEEVKEACAKTVEAKDAEIGYMNEKIEEKDEYIKAQDDYIDGKKSISQRMNDLHELYNMNLITVEEFERIKVQILSEI